MDYPHILVMCESPPSSTQGYGVTLATLVQNWPKDRLFVLYRSEIYRDDHVPDYSTTHAQLPGHLLKDAIPYARGQRPAWNGNFSDRWIRQQLGNWQPDAIYGFFYDASIPRYLEWLSRIFECPYAVHIGDDNPTLRNGADIPGIYRRAAIKIAISEEMAREYQQRYGVPFDVLHNGAADELFTDSPAEGQTDDAIVVRYIGSLLRDQHWEAIEDFAEAVKLLNQTGHKVRFEIYCDKWTADLAKELADGKNVFYSGFAAKPRNYELLKSADLLLLPVTFSDKFLGAYRFSMPTKLCEYLGSGTPTLIYGPRGPASVEFCVRNNIALVQTERSVDALVEVLRNLVADRNHFREVGSRDRIFAKENLSARSMAERFRDLMIASWRKSSST